MQFTPIFNSIYPRLERFRLLFFLNNYINFLTNFNQTHTLSYLNGHNVIAYIMNKYSYSRWDEQVGQVAEA